MFFTGLDLASLIPATVEVEATNAPVRFSASRVSDNGRVVNGNDIVRNTATLMEETSEPHSIVDLNGLLTSSAAAYAHLV